jgi:hypothetical protein
MLYILEESALKKKNIHLRHVHLMFENNDAFPCKALFFLFFFFEEPTCVGVHEIACPHKTSQEVLRNCGSTLPRRLRSQKAWASATNFQVPMLPSSQHPSFLFILSASHPGAISAPRTKGPGHSPFWHVVVVVVVVGLP